MCALIVSLIANVLTYGVKIETHIMTPRKMVCANVFHVLESYSLALFWWETHSVIDHILISKRFQSSVNLAQTRTFTKMFTGADIGRDHELVLTSVRVKLKKKGWKRLKNGKSTRIKFDLEKFKDPDFKLQFRGKFAPLLTAHFIGWMQQGGKCILSNFQEKFFSIL